MTSTRVQNDQTLCIRADAGSTIGDGHIMRCFALAQGWHDAGGRVRFLGCLHSKELIRLIVDEGFEYTHLPARHPDPSDLLMTLDALAGTSSGTWVVLDGYHLEPSYQKSIRDRQFRVLVVDDDQRFGYYHADILLNQNYGAQKLRYRAPKKTRRLLGTSYIMLRRDFAGKGLDRDIPVMAKNILITMGGADPAGATLTAVRAAGLMGRAFDFRCVVGPSNHKVAEVEIAAESAGVEIVKAPAKIPDLLAWADVAVICAGGTLWECLCTGCPAVSLSLSRIQEDILSDMGPERVRYMGPVDKASPEFLAWELNALAYDQVARQRMSEQGKKLVDGRGVDRVVNVMSMALEVDK